MTLGDVKASIKGTVDAVWPGIVAQQNAYQLAAGRYVQLLPTHTEESIPADGVGVTPDNMGNKPTDRSEYWINFDLSGLPLQPLSQSQCHEWQSADDVGFIWISRFKYSGDIWCCEWNYTKSTGQTVCSDWFIEDGE